MFADTFKLLRKERKLTQQQLADNLGLSRSSVGMYEKGEREPNFETTIKIADYFNVSVNYLITNKEIENCFLEMQKKQLMLSIFGKEVNDELLEDVLQYAQYLMIKENNKNTNTKPKNSVKIIIKKRTT